MKASEVLQQYAQGRRDFQGVNLRGLSFKNQDLSGANFSGADIRSTNFRGAKLEGTRFIKARAGLHKRWMILLLIIVLILAALSGFLSLLNGAMIALIFDTSDLESIVLGWTSLAIWVTFLIILLHQGFLGAFAFIAFAFTFAVAIAFTAAFAEAIALDFAFALAFSVIFAGAGAGTFALAFAGAGAVAVVVALAFAGAGAVSGAVAVAFTGAFALAFAGAGAVDFAFTFAEVGDFAFTFALAFAGAGAETLISISVSFYVAYRAMKGDEKYALIRHVAVALAAIGGTSFRGADLTEANFTNTILRNTDFREANLTRTRWKKVNKLDLARPGKSILAQWDVRELLVSGKGQGQDFSKADLRGANLNYADLSYANLTQADLSQATLHQANLEGANLTEINAIGTDLSEATLTAACIEAWNTDSTTQLDDINCDYIYLLNHQQERRPSSGIFAPGEFTKLFQEVFNTVDLIFQDGVNWKAFVSAFKQVQVENEGTELTVQSIENKGDGVIVVKVQVPLDTDKEKIHSDFTQNYEFRLQALEREYKAQLQMKDSEIESYKRESVNILEITKLLASRPINTEANAVVNNSSETFNNNLQGANIGNYANNVVKDNACQHTSQYNYAPEQKQSLAEAAAEIQQLLEQLSQTYSPAEAEHKVAEDLAQKAKQDPSFKENLKSWSQSLLGKGSETAVVETVKEGVKRVIPLAISMLI